MLERRVGKGIRTSATAATNTTRPTFECARHHRKDQWRHENPRHHHVCRRRNACHYEPARRREIDLGEVTLLLRFVGCDSAQ